MRDFTLILFILLSISINAQKNATEKANDQIIQNQVDAYNEKNLELFSSFYAETITFYDYPNTLLFKGKKAFTDRFKKRFLSDDLHCEVKQKMFLGNKVIYEEFITVNGRSYTVLAIYELENQKIVKLTFIRK